MVKVPGFSIFLYKGQTSSISSTISIKRLRLNSLNVFKKMNSFDKCYVHSYTRSHATLLKLFQIWEFVVKLTIQTLIAEQTDIASHTWTIMEIP